MPYTQNLICVIGILFQNVYIKLNKLKSKYVQLYPHTHTVYLCRAMYTIQGGLQSATYVEYE